MCWLETKTPDSEVLSDRKGVIERENRRLNTVTVE
jgi:hypothetical protein